MLHDPGERAQQKKRDRESIGQAHRWRGELLTPFILLHWSGQVGFKDLSDDEKVYYLAGSKLLRDGATELLSMFDALLKLPCSRGERVALAATGDEAKRLIEKIKRIASELVNPSQNAEGVFNAVGTGNVEVVKDGIGSMMTTIEELADVVEAVVAYVEFGDRPSF